MTHYPKDTKFGFDFQAAKGTGVASAYFVPLLEGNVTITPSLAREEVADGTRFQTRSLATEGYDFGFDFKMVLKPGESVGAVDRLIYGLFGDVATSGPVSDYYTHDLTPEDPASALPWFSFEVDRGVDLGGAGTDYTERYVDGKIDAFSLELAPRTGAPVSIGVTGHCLSRDSTTYSGLSTSYNDEDPYVFKDLSVFLEDYSDGSEATSEDTAVRRITFNYSNGNVVESEEADGTGDMSDISEGIVTVTGEIDKAFASSDDYQDFLADTYKTMKIELLKTADQKEIKFLVQKVKIAGLPLPGAGPSREKGVYTMTYEAVYDGTNDLCTASTYNKVADITT